MTEWEWYDDPNTKSLFIHLLLSANIESKNWKGVEVQRGCLITGRDKLAQILGISPRSVRTSLNKLKTTNEIAIKTTNAFSLIQVLNYDKYQSQTTSKRANE